MVIRRSIFKARNGVNRRGPLRRQSRENIAALYTMVKTVIRLSVHRGL